MKAKAITTLFVIAAIFTFATIIDCGGNHTPPPTTGFKAYGQNYFLASDGTAQFFVRTSVQGFELFDYSGAQGGTTSFNFFCGSGACNVAGGRVPARWRIIPNGGACLVFLTPLDRDVTVGSTQQAACLIPNFGALSADPSSINLQAPPASVTISGGGFDATYGMPLIEYYDQYSGDLIASATASWVAADGLTLQLIAPDLMGVTSGSYNIVVSNIAADLSTTPVGVAPVTACCIDPLPPDPPPDPPPCGADQVCTVY
jgi:hypothetical protein